MTEGDAAIVEAAKAWTMARRRCIDATLTVPQPALGLLIGALAKAECDLRDAVMARYTMRDAVPVAAAELAADWIMRDVVGAAVS